jgi:DNA polymerase epsilon subunit 1
VRLLDVREFSAAADFRNPCMSFVLSDVVCSFCNHCQDIDLCRDESVLAHQWTCRHCQQPYVCFLSVLGLTVCLVC